MRKIIKNVKIDFIFLVIHHQQKCCFTMIYEQMQFCCQKDPTVETGTDRYVSTFEMSVSKRPTQKIISALIVFEPGLVTN